MAIYRGPGGSGDATNDASSEVRLAVEARDAAIAAQLAAEAAEAGAVAAQSGAETAETNAETAETNAETAATSASSAASAAHTYADNAAASASDAADSATAADASATSASSSASAASTSASSASTSATNAASSASSASTSATNAASSASSASTSASAASSSASAAATSETNAASSASSASTSASTATTQAGIATTQASNASTSATNAASSASSASTSATNASNSASAASTSATNAASSATAASAAQSAAESARDAALSAYDNFDDRYLGPKSSDPTLDNDGNALISGALYFNTTTNVMKVYDGSAWLAAYVSAAGVLLAANNLSDLTSASTARTNLGLGTAATTASTDYATAAQGTKADSALQPADIGVSVQGYDADLAAIGAIAGTSGLLKKTAANTWSLDTNTYLTSYTETDPIYTASSWYSTTNNASNWDTAYGWGNHASAGYAADSSVVHKTGDETISGTKTFSSTITGSVSGNAGTVTNGVYTSGSYADPSWITSLDDGKVLPSMSSNSGKYLTTDGTNSSWATVDALPDQTGNSGKYLTTNGTAASWASLNTDANSTTKGLYEHSNTISANYSISSGNNAMSAGPVSVASGITVTIPSGSVWTIV